MYFFNRVVAMGTENQGEQTPLIGGKVSEKPTLAVPPVSTTLSTALFQRRVISLGPTRQFLPVSLEGRGAGCSIRPSFPV